MAKSNPDGIETGMMMVVTYLTLFAVNATVVIFANTLFPLQVVLGTNALSPVWAVLHSMGILALLDTFAVPFIRQYERSQRRMLTNMEWMSIYLVLNFVGIWLITRFSDQVGMGVSTWMVALVLAFILDAVQGVVMMQLEKYRIKS